MAWLWRKKWRSAVHNINLNALTIPTDVGVLKMKDPSVRQGSTRCYFRGLREAFLAEMAGFKAVLGCVAWFTDREIMAAMRELECVSIIVQKEDFLRPDSGRFSAGLRESYSDLPTLNRWEMPYLVAHLSTSGDPTWDAVRCVGNHNSSHAPAHPRMHNKFAVFCDVVETTRLERVAEPRDDGNLFEQVHETALVPRKVWTGSFNVTHNGSNSLENAVVIEAPEIVDAYTREWAQIACLSEPLDWTTPWVAPEHRIGS
jgi:hypothetical protein